MFKIIKQLFLLLTPLQRRNFYYLQCLVIVMAIMEIVGVASIIPFMALIGDVSQLQEDSIFGNLFLASGITSEFKFVLIVGLIVLIMLIIASLTSIFTIWRLTKFSHNTGAELADRLYSHYLTQDWLFHASGNSSNLTKKIATETPRTTQGVIVQLMQMNAKVVLALFVTITIFIYDPKVAISGFLIFSSAYLIIFSLVQKRLQNNGKNISEVYQERFTLMNEGFGGIKDILLLGRDSDFIKRFKHSGQRMAYGLSNNAALAQAPRYLIELVAFGSIILLVIYLFISHNGDLGAILPSISVYAIASIKILPAFQQIYSSIADIRANFAAFESIHKDLVDSSEALSLKAKKYETIPAPKQQILIENVTFKYEAKDKPVLNGLHMDIPINSTVGIVGPSGSGKSTLIDILLGLIQPHEGHLKIDNIIIDNKNRRSWQNRIGFVAQSIFLSDRTFAENVAFGISKDQINFDRVKKALEMAHLDDLVDSLENGINTNVGERGVQLSGGQRQRIGIARALYHEADVLIFDEATSSLDGITEQMIMEAINKFSGQKTIILIAHRLKTVKDCDKLFFINNGQVTDSGTYDELIETNVDFKKMASHS
jgi:ATP-binding cassette, subfamily B, bacterial PglK